MNSDKIEGSMKDAAGKVQREIGKATGSTSQEVKGAAKQVEGKAQKGIGEARDAVDRADERGATDTRTNRPDGGV